MGLLRDHKRAIIIGGSILIVTCLMLSVFGGSVGRVAVYSFKERWNRIQFDSAKWQDPSVVTSHNPIRLRMVDDLLKRYDFYGMKRDEVIQIIGVPDDVERLSTEPEALTGWDMAYWLGPERKPIFGFDAEWLVLRLDKQGRVSDYRVVTD